MASRIAFYLLLCCLITSSRAQSVTIGFEQMIYTVYEGDEVEVCVNLNGDLANRTVVVTLATDDMVGSGGMLISMDYVPVSENFTFSSDTELRACVNITTIFNAGTNAASFNMSLTTTDEVTLNPAAATVNIQDVTAPNVITQPMDVEGAFPDTEVNFTVVAEGGALSYQWFRNGEEISGATQATLTLTNVNIEMDEGMYHCFISNPAGNVTTNNVSLTILRRPEIAVLEAPTGSLLNQQITITCMTVINATITVMVNESDGTSLSLTDVGTTENSRSVNVTVMNTGRHNVTCVADNNGLTETNTTQFYGITVSVADVTAGITATAVFFCNVIGATVDDGVTYIWHQTQNGVVPVTTFPPVVFENRIRGLGTAMLEIYNLSGREQDFDYRCAVSISGMEIGSAIGALTSPGPMILVGPVDKELQAGDKLALNCTGMNNIDATRPLRINWMFTSFDTQNSQVVFENDSTNVIEMRDNLTVTSSFTIDSVMPNDGGIYGCLVFNREDVDSVVETATVNVLFTPQIVFMATPSAIVPRGGTPQLKCTVMAVPPANNSEIVRIFPDETEEVLANVTNPDGERELRLRHVLEGVRFPEDDGAIFECRAINANGEAVERVRITVQAPPAEIDHENGVSARLASLNSINITWSMPSSNNADILSYTLMFCALFMPTDTDCSQGTSVNATLMVGGTELIRIGENQLRYTLPELVLGKMYLVVITAENSIGRQMSPEFVNGFRFNSTSPDDGRVVNVDSIPTTSTIILTWRLPPLALATSDLNVSFDITYVSVTSPGNERLITVEYNSSRLEQGSTINIGMVDSPLHNFQIVARYITPNLLSSQATLNGVRTLADNVPLLTGPQAVVSENVGTNDVLTVSWPTPNNTNFLVAYSVSYTTSSVRNRRQTPLVKEVLADMTSTTLPFTAFMRFTVNVDAVYAPPPDGSRVSIPLLPSTTFTTPQRQSSVPRGIMAANESVIKIRFSWTVPDDPNGIIVGYRVRLTKRNEVNGEEFRVEGGNTLTYLSQELDPAVGYMFEIAAINGFGNGMFSPAETYTAGFSVFPPVITGTAVGGADAPQFTITIDRFSEVYGAVAVYKIVVVRGSPVDPSTISDNSLAPAGVSQFNYYVAFRGDSQRGRTSFTIGDGVMTTDGSTTFTNPRPETGVDYYVFIRLYSGIDPAMFADSDLSGVLRINTPLNPAVIIAPIAVVAVLLLVILIVLLVIVFLFTRPRRGYSIAATEDGVHRKKRGGGLELRRTRLFSPVVNVPVPDVFTSAGQPTTLVCEASGTPAPDVVWTQNNEPLDKERFIQLADSSLFINDTDLKDEGAYIVTATNSAGTAEQMVRVTVIRPSPPEPDPEHPPIQVGEFTEKIALLRANDDEGLEDEYSEVEPDITFTSYAAKININKNKNRYINIIPYDHSRVVLSLQDNTPGSDYINASYVDGFNRPNSYIATQGPQPSTFPDFWRMVWEFDCPTIVMVTNLKEEDKLKCHQYWPNYGSTTYGSIQVTLKGVENLAEYSIRTFQITPIAGQSRVQMPAREVKQFHFLVWPDHGVPQFATPLLSFRKRVAKYHPDKKGPMVVHCSAGVGRTGTFITIDTMLRQMESEGLIDIFNFVRHMRFRRNYMVQTAPQYVFIHDALLEAIMCGDNSIPAPELRKRLQDLMEVDPESKKSKLQLQFENLNSNSPQDDDFDSTIASLPDNMAKNRFKVHLPANDYRVPLGAPPPRSEGGDDDDDDEDEKKEKEEPDYICASFADGYRQRNAFIITQAPMSNTTGDFWKMIWEQKSAAIVMLTELEEDGKEMSVKYWPGEVGEASLFGSFQLELSEDEKDKGDYVTRKFKLSHVDAPQDCRIVTQFHFTKWPRSSTPKNPHSVIDLIDEIQRVQRKSGNQPITIHCDDGVSRTGAFCTLYSVLERVKVDQVVDVYLATKTLRIQRAGLLETLDQYIFVHKAVIEFLDSFSDYQNFK